MMHSLIQTMVIVELDPHLLATPFDAQTNWHVITGAPCSGKTTLIDLLVDRGFQVVPEVGRKYIEKEIAQGRTLKEIRTDQLVFDRTIRELQLEIEAGLRPEDVLFLDRGYPDSLAFYRLHGMNPNEILPACFRRRYASVFVLDRFPTRQDCARIEDDIIAEFLDEMHPRDYTSLGYTVVRVPVLPPEERLDFLLARCEGKT